MGEDPRRIGALEPPKLFGSGGRDGAVVELGLSRGVAMGREQAMLPHEVEHPFPGDLNAIHHPPADPEIAVTLGHLKDASPPSAQPAKWVVTDRRK